MKVLPVALAAHIATRNTTLAVALKITRPDTTVYAFTSHDVDDTVGGITYLASPGLIVTDIAQDQTAAVGNLELTTLHDGTVFTTIDILGGLWRNSEFEIFRYNYNGLTDGIDVLMAGTIGEVEIRQNTVVAELRDYRQYLQQPIGDASSKLCRARLGDARCKKDLTAFTVTGTITAVSSNSAFTDAGNAAPDDAFGEGLITWLTGNNMGISNKVRAFATGGIFSLALPTFGNVQVGDTYTAIYGCRKRLVEDCGPTKFDNVLNFVGEPHRQGRNSIVKAPQTTTTGAIVNAQPFEQGPTVVAPSGGTEL